MKTYLNILAGAGFATAALLLAGCQNDFEVPPMQEPTSSLEANISIADLKAMMWTDESNYADKCPLKDEENGIPYIIKGRVISSDASGNVYKALYIQDETAAIAFSINQSDMSGFYPVGQEVAVELVDMYVGRYGGLEQVGNVTAYSTSMRVGFMPYEIFASHAQRNGWPKPETTIVKYGKEYPSDGIYAINTDIATLKTILANTDKTRNMQCQLVRLNDVHFDGVGLPWVEGYIVGSLHAGISNVTSNEDVIWGPNADMNNTIVIGPDPECKDYKQCLVMELPVNSELRAKVNLVDNPNMYGQEIKVQGNLEQFLGTYGLTGNKGTADEFWVEGMEVTATTLTYAVDGESGVDRTLYDEKGNSIIVRTSGYSDFWNLPLPVGTGNITGLMGYYSGNWQLVIRSTADCDFATKGPWSDPYTVAEAIAEESKEPVVEPDDPDDPNMPAAAGDGSESNPYNVAFVNSSTEDVNGVWVEGYVAGFVNSTSSFDEKTGVFSDEDDHDAGPYLNQSNIILSAFAPPQAAFKNSVPVQLAAASRPTLGLKDNPDVYGKKVKVKCNISSYLGVRGIKKITEVIVEL